MRSLWVLHIWWVKVSCSDHCSCTGDSHGSDCCRDIMFCDSHDVRFHGSCSCNWFMVCFSDSYSPGNILSF